MREGICRRKRGSILSSSSSWSLFLRTPFLPEKLLIAFHARPSIYLELGGKEQGSKEKKVRKTIRDQEDRETRRNGGRVYGEKGSGGEASGSGVTAEREGYPVPILMLHPPPPSDRRMPVLSRQIRSFSAALNQETWKGKRDKCLKSANASNAQPLHFTLLRCVCVCERD